jgi:hypothetical protein
MGLVAQVAADWETWLLVTTTNCAAANSGSGPLRPPVDGHFSR